MTLTEFGVGAAALLLAPVFIGLVYKWWDYVLVKLGAWPK